MTPLQTRIRIGSILLLIAISCVARFIGQESAPPGFYIDEAAGAMNIICVAQDFTSESGVKHPLFFPEFGAFFTAPYVYFGALWSKVFGHSIASLRAIAAFFNLLTILGLGFLAFYFFGLDGALFTALSASISPWSFQFSRIAWDPPLMPCFLIWGIYFFLRFRKNRLAPFIAGVLVSLAMYSYPPARIQAPLLMLALSLLLLKTRELNFKDILLFGASVLVVSSPLIVLTLNGTLQGRFNVLSIFSPNYLNTHPGEAPLGTLFHNVLLHFSPTFLFLTGDQNLRHSTQFTGELSWLDIFALSGGIFLIFCSSKSLFSSTFKQKKFRIFLVLISVGILGGIFPAALTWEAVPHALRALGAWPFFALLSGAGLVTLQKYHRHLASVAIVLAAIFIFSFGRYFFNSYNHASFLWFDSTLKEQALSAKVTGDWTGFQKAIKGYADVSARYYLVEYGGENCQSSISRLQSLRSR